jgi:hypothetical protein
MIGAFDCRLKTGCPGALLTMAVPFPELRPCLVIGATGLGFRHIRAVLVVFSQLNSGRPCCPALHGASLLLPLPHAVQLTSSCIILGMGFGP